MGNWRTVNMTGTMTEQDAAALREYLGYRSYRSGDRTTDPAFQRFGPLSFCRDQPSICGVNAWPAAAVMRSGNLAERDYDVEDIAAHLRELVIVAPSMLLAVHCGGEYESLDCVATIRVGEGMVAVGKPEVEKLAEIGEDQQLGNLFRALTGG